MEKGERRMQDETMEQLTAFFEENSDLKVFGMNGSRTNKNIPLDRFKDYDVVFFTDEVLKYKNDSTFLSDFGEILLFTEPEIDASDPLFPENEGYIYLVQYTDGTRIDIQFRMVDKLDAYLKEDSLTQIIGDKEGRVTSMSTPSDSDYWLKQPTQSAYEQSIKEFWWEFNNTLKATLRGELLLAQFYLNLTREELILLMTWTIAQKYGYAKNYGKKYTKLLDHLSDSEQAILLSTFDTGSVESIYKALKRMKQLEERYTKAFEEGGAVDYQSLLPLKDVPSKYLKSKGYLELADFFC
ncbi:aminoglycoside 6-adenylyltransferase [Enterococcus larvae]|uniref:aminoglycoside 6-adenylyltransferase n=1 Tax=Enterococcus larvae TaxID=2794352 RepID=UPI003F3C00F7